VSPVIFDLDGVLVDSRDLYAEVIAAVLGRVGHLVADDEIVAARVPHVPRWVAALVPSGAPVGDLVSAVRDGVAARSGELDIRPGTARLLTVLASRHHLFLLTNSTARFAGSVLERHGIARHFRQIITSDDGFGPKESAIVHIAGLCNATPRETVYIGDTLGDVEAARKAGCRVVILHTEWSWDHGSLGAIEEARPDAVAGSLEQVGDIIDGWHA